jgi:hypothetical protein
MLVESTVFGEEFSSELKIKRICLKLQESVSTAKYRLKALNAFHPSNRSTVGGRIPNRIDGETVRDALEGAGVEDYVHVPEPEPAKDDDGDAGDWDNIPGGPIFPPPPATATIPINRQFFKGSRSPESGITTSWVTSALKMKPK